MNRRIATAATAGLRAAGCAGSTETVEMLQAEMQGHVNALEVLQLDLQGAETAPAANATTFLAQPRDTVSSTNSLTSSVVAQIRLVLTRGTTVRDITGSLVVTMEEPLAVDQPGCDGLPMDPPLL
jgi:hypothetical protein